MGTLNEPLSKLGDPKQLAYEAAGIPTEVHVPRKFNWLWITLLVLGFPLWGSLALAAFLILLSIDIVIWCIPLQGLFSRRNDHWWCRCGFH